MYYYCEKCKTFTLPCDTPTKFDGWDRRDAVCGNCSVYLMQCNWYFTGIRNYPDRVKASRIDLDKLYGLCYTCNMRFNCWTGN